jgi:hypothetical protein
MSSIVPSRAVLIGTAIVLAAVGLFSYPAGPPFRNAYGIPRCAAGAAEYLLSVDALQCWFDAPRGRWRTLSRESQHDVLVVHVEALDARDAEEIARRFVAGERELLGNPRIHAARITDGFIKNSAGSLDA